MPEETPSQETQETTTSVVTPLQPKTVTPTATQTAEPEEEEFDKERAMATIRKLREFEKTAKNQLKDLETLKAEKEAAELAKLSENERIQKQLTDQQAKTAEEERKRLELENELAAERRIRRVIGIASTLGALDPQDANIMAATATIDPSDASADEDIKQAIEALKQAKPYLFKPSANAVRVETFNPGNASGGAETDAQRVARVRRQQGQQGSVFSSPKE